MKKNNNLTGSTEKAAISERSTVENQKDVSLAKRIVLLGIPFVLFVIGVAFLSVFIFKTYFENSVYFSLMVNASLSGGGRTGDEELGLNITREDITPSIYTAIVPVTKSTGSGEDTSSASEAPSSPSGNQDPVETTEPEYEIVQYHDYSEFPPIPWGDCWGTMTISSIGLRGAPMYNGDDTQILSYTHSKAIGKRYGSQFPGQGGVTILCSHVTRAFYGLQDMEKGDKITLNTFYGKYVYEVTEIRIFSADNNSILHEKFPEETLICYTCYPRGSSVRTKRIAVICKKISGIDWVRTGDK